MVEAVSKPAKKKVYAWAISSLIVIPPFFTLPSKKEFN